jgi:hypothetical protein
MSGIRIVVSGYIGQYPMGGVAWDYIQFFLGLRSLGHDVYYVEDTGQWPYNPDAGGLIEQPDCSFNVAYVSDLFARFEAEDRWSYRFFWDDSWYGVSKQQRAEVLRTADVIVNVSGSLIDPARYGDRAKRVYVDTDPVFTQVKLESGNTFLADQVASHHILFTVGETLPGSELDSDLNWRPMRHPIVLSEWKTDLPPGDAFTTVMNWTSYGEVRYRGEVYGQKDTEMRKFIELPRLASDASFELAVNVGRTRGLPRELLMHRGWRLVDPAVVCPDFDGYRRYIQGSLAEWSVAKQGYVSARSGWFSGRSAAYLASGRPVVVQDTGFSDVLPVGEGLLAFTTIEEAAAGVAEVLAHPDRHAARARDLAEEYFDARRVLSGVVDAALGAPHRE